MCLAFSAANLRVVFGSGQWQSAVPVPDTLYQKLNHHQKLQIILDHNGPGYYAFVKFRRSTFSVPNPITRSPLGQLRSLQVIIPDHTQRFFVAAINRIVRIDHFPISAGVPYVAGYQGFQA